MKIEVKKTEGVLHFEKVEVRTAEVQDIINAQRSTGATEGAAYTTALMAEICTFDGKKLTYEDLRRMSMADFLDLQTELMLSGVIGSEELYSHLFEKLGSGMKKSEE